MLKELKFIISLLGYSNPTEDEVKEPMTALGLALVALFIAGIGLSVWSVYIYRDSLIHWSIPFCLAFFSGLAVSLYNHKFLIEKFKKKNYFLIAIFNIASFGSIICFLVLFLNFYFAKENIDVVKVPILESGNLAKGKNGCGNPFAHVEINGFPKELIFDCRVEISKYKFVEVETQQGLIGYKIISNKRLLVN